jgi:hypothetical protein
MTSSSDIFHLIRSMTQSEKRYFKVFASRHIIGDENDYVKLFDAIEKQKKYDERALNVASISKTLASNFPVAKSYLYKMILKSMRAFRLDTGIENKISGLIQGAIYLFEKALHKQSYRLLKKAKKIAYEYERFKEILQIIVVERGIANQLGFAEDPLEVFKRIENEEKQILSLLGNISAYENWSHKVYTYQLKKGEIRSPAERHKFIELFDPRKSITEKEPLSYKAKCFYCHGHSMYYNGIEDIRKSYEFQKKRLALYDEYPPQRKADENNYLSVLHNLLLRCLALNKHDEFKKHLLAMRKVRSTSKWVNARIFESSYGLELEYCISTGDLVRGLKLVDQIQESLHEYKGKLNKVHELNLYNQVFRLYLYKEQYNRCLSWLNLFMNDPQVEMTDSSYTYSRIINLIVHYELENIESLPYLLKSAYRYLVNSNSLFKTERYILEFIKEALKVSDNYDLKKQLKKLKSNILSLDDSYEKQSLLYSDLPHWIDKKMAVLNRTAKA